MFIQRKKKDTLDQTKISKILGSDMETVKGDGIQQYIRRSKGGEGSREKTARLLSVAIEEKDFERQMELIRESLRHLNDSNLAAVSSLIVSMLKGA